MPRLVWTPPSSRDLRRHYDFLAQKDQKSAVRAIKTIRQRLQALLKHPEMGRPLDGPSAGRRELVIDFGQSSYVALYEQQQGLVLVLSVRHSREAGY